MKLHKIWAAVGTALALLPAIVVVAAPSAQAQTYSVLYAFRGGHGRHPWAGLVQAKNGNLFGTTTAGGTYKGGVVFRLEANGKYKVLYSFTGGAEDGDDPVAGLVRDSAGNLYGTTEFGGAYNDGVVFKLDTSGAETVLHSFTSGADGRRPEAGLVRDSAGNLYGTTVWGGVAPCIEHHGCGTVFKVDTSGAETVLYNFTGGGSGALPAGGLVRDSAGNLYGTTWLGGGGYGTVFMLSPGSSGWTETVLYSFCSVLSCADGVAPEAGLVRDSAGNLYGTTRFGGTAWDGVVFKLSPSSSGWTESVQYTFTGGADGANPLAGLVRDSAGNLYGTTEFGGAYNDGVVFKLDPTGAETVLHTFTGGADGKWPLAGLLLDSVGNLYGTTSHGGAYNGGVVFKITPQ